MVFLLGAGIFFFQFIVLLSNPFLPILLTEFIIISFAKAGFQTRVHKLNFTHTNERLPGEII